MSNDEYEGEWAGEPGDSSPDYDDDAPPSGALIRVAAEGLAPMVTSQYQMMVMLAKQYPRHLPTITKKLQKQAELLGSKKSKSGDGCLGYYSIKFGKGDRATKVEGITIHMAQAIRNEYGNCATQVLIENVKGSVAEGGVVTGGAFFFDAEKVRMSMRPMYAALPAAPGAFANKFDSAQRWRSMAVAKAVSIAERSIIERSVPRTLVDDCFQWARDAHEKTILGGLSLDEAKSRTAATLKAKGVTLEEAERYVEEAWPHWSSKELVLISEALAGIKAGHGTVDSVFRPPAEVANPTTVVDLSKATASSPSTSEAPPPGNGSKPPEGGKKKAPSKGKAKPEAAPEPPVAPAAPAAPVDPPAETKPANYDPAYDDAP